MESSTSKSEAEILRTLRSRFEREGYTFIPHPTKDMVPAFLGGYQPDALALSDKKSLVIEIKSRRSPSGDSRLAQLAERVKAAPGWDLHIVYAGDFSRPVYSKPSRNEVVELLNEVFDLYHKDLLRPALLMGWAALEAIARSAVLEESQGSGPMIPSQIVEQLAQLGYIDASSARTLRHIISVRNAVAHGEMSLIVTKEDVTTLLQNLERLFNELYPEG